MRCLRWRLFGPSMSESGYWLGRVGYIVFRYEKYDGKD